MHFLAPFGDFVTEGTMSDCHYTTAVDQVCAQNQFD